MEYLKGLKATNPICALASSTYGSGGERIEAYFASLEAAKIAFNQKIDSLKFRMGVDIIEQSETSFTFLLGWEERQVSWYIKTIQMYDVK